MRRNLSFIVVMFVGLIIFSSPLLQLVKLSFGNELYSHFLLIPLVSIYFLWTGRKRIFGNTAYSVYIGVAILLSGVAGYVIGVANANAIDLNDYLSLCTFGFIAWILGGFTFFFGMQAFRRALFPLLFLVFMIPIPLFILEPLIRFLQVQSAHAVHGIFEVIGIPYLREGMIFEVPGLAIEVAKECSGIRSSLALFITSVAAGHMFLQTGWRRVVLSLAVFPLTIFKNALRITTLALLAAYVDPSWITSSWLHRAGGKPFFILALCLMLPLILLLRRSERKDSRTASSGGSGLEQMDTKSAK